MNNPKSSTVRIVMPPGELREELERREASGIELRDRAVAGMAGVRQLEDDAQTWHEYNATLLKRAFTTEEIVAEYVGTEVATLSSHDMRERFDAIRALVGDRVRYLGSLRERLSLFPPADGEGTQSSSMPENRTKVFIVHGHNEARKWEVSQLVTRLTGSEPVILHEMVNAGRTIIEKFEDHAGSVAFAIILLTGDDEGRRIGEGFLTSRARQNVIFEHGFFIAKLGRSRVAALVEGKVEQPSDLSGVLYTSFETGWQLQLAGEMKAAGIKVDANNILLTDM